MSGPESTLWNTTGLLPPCDAQLRGPAPPILAGASRALLQAENHAEAGPFRSTGSSPASVGGSQGGGQPGTKGPGPLNLAHTGPGQGQDEFPLTSGPCGPPSSARESCGLLAHRPQTTELQPLSPPAPTGQTGWGLCNATCVPLGSSYPFTVTPAGARAPSQPCFPSPPHQRDIRCCSVGAVALPCLPSAASQVSTERISHLASPLTGPCSYPGLPPAWAGGRKTAATGQASSMCQTQG